MSELLITLAVLACPVGMGLMMMFMMRGRRGDTDTDQSQHEEATDVEIARLRAEVDQLRAAPRDTRTGDAFHNEADRP